jgi:hypothetical protein
MKHLSRSRKLLRTAVALVLLGWALPLLVPVNYLRKQVAAALAETLHRPVQVGNIHIQLLGGPGLQASNVLVEEHPAFGSDPFVRAEAVEARLSLASIWRGRLEFSRLTMIRPSFNLVRNESGDWNLETLVFTPNGATEDSTPLTSRAGLSDLADSPPQPPHVRIESGRINFRFGERKKGASIQGLDLDLLPPEAPGGSWRFEAEGMPSRADIPFRATSVFRLRGEVGPFVPTMLQEPGIPLRLDWGADGAMLSELLTIAYGYDPGVHSMLSLEGHLSGTTSLFRFSAEARFEDLHRWDLLAAPEASSIRATFSGVTDLAAASLQLASFSIPLGEGSIELRGRVEQLFGKPDPKLEAEIRELPLTSVAALAPHFTTRVSPTVAAGGAVSGHLRLEPLAGEWSGALQVSDGFLRPSASTPSVRFTGFPIVLEGRTGKLGPIQANPGQGEPVQVSLRWDADGAFAALQLRGEKVSLSQLAGAAKGFGMQWSGEAQEGTVGLRVSVTARAGQPTRVTGWAQLDDAEIVPAGFTEPLQIASARVLFQPDRVRIEPLNARFGSTELSGTVDVEPTFFSGPSAADRGTGIYFNLAATDVAVEEFASLFRNPPTPGSLFRFREPAPAWNTLWISEATVPISGSLRADKLSWNGTTLENLSATVSLADGKLEISDFIAEHAGGRHHATGSVSFEHPLAFAVQTEYTNLQLDELALPSQRWRGLLAGTLSGVLRLSGSGASWREVGSLLAGVGGAHVSGFAVRSAAVAAALGEGETESRLDSLDASFQIADGQIRITEVKATQSSADEPGERTWAASGDVDFDQRVNLLVSSHSGDEEAEFVWSGTLFEPRATRITNAAAARVSTSPAAP